MIRDVKEAFGVQNHPRSAMGTALLLDAVGYKPGVGIVDRVGQDDHAEIRALARKYDNYSAFMDSVLQDNECEVLCTQTLGASAINLAEHGEAFSYLEQNGCGIDNAKSQQMQRLIADGYLVLGKHDGRETVIMTKLLLTTMRDHLNPK